MNKMLKKAQEMQAKLQEEIAALRVEATSGGDAVKAVVDGQKGLVSLEISPEVLEDADAEMVSDLVLAAVHEAQRQADEQVQKKMGSFAGAMGLPPGMGL